MVEPGKSAAAREEGKKTTSTAASMKKKLMTNNKRPEIKESRKQSSSCTEPASPSYRLALKSLFSCRNSHGRSHNHASAPEGRSKKLGCSAPSICKLKDNDRVMQQNNICKPSAAEQQLGAAGDEPCKRRASVSGSSERCVKKPLSEVDASKKQLQRGTSLSSSSSSTGGGSSSFRLRRLSGCYECHMVVDPISGSSSSMRVTTICPCPDCGEIFLRQETLQLHQSIRHAVSELGSEDTSRNIIEIIFQSSWLKKQSPVCKINRILKVHNTPRTLARFEEYRDAVKARAGGAKKHPRCTADGNELLRFHCATLACSLGLHGATHLCDAASTLCAACGIIRDGFKASAGHGIVTMATSGRAHDAVAVEEDERRAMLVCRVIAGRVKRPPQEEEEAAAAEEYESVVGSAGVYSNLEELQVFNPRAILPCFVVVYKAS